MVTLINEKHYLYNGVLKSEKELRQLGVSDSLDNGYRNTIAYSILSQHNDSKTPTRKENLRLRFDCMASHDITYVGIIETAKASGLEAFPIPYVLTNCHNSLCAVGGTINEDDHRYGLSAAKKYGGIYVPPHLAVIHTYMRERMAGCGKMILGSDSHTRYGAIGTMAIGEGGGELVKQLLGLTYDVKYPDVVAVELTGRVRHGVGPQDVAIAIIGAVFKSGFVKNKVLEFIGEGIAALPQEYRNGIDVMTTETACLSSIWQTDEVTKSYLTMLGRSEEYKALAPEQLAEYDAVIKVDLSKVEPMIALPFHPSNAFKLQDVISNPYEILSRCQEEGRALTGNKSFDLLSKIKNGKVYVDQGVIAGCAGGTFDNIFAAAGILGKGDTGNGDFSLSVYPSSQPTYIELTKRGITAELMEAGCILKTAFCGPCFGAGDVPHNNALSIRHTTRNFENREGSRPYEGQIASVALMDARSIAATAKNGGELTSSLEYEYKEGTASCFDPSVYQKRVYDGYKKSGLGELEYGPNITSWPKISPLADNLVVEIASSIYDDVTTTDELIPSGETSSYRSNPLRLAEFTLSRKDPEYVKRAKAIKAKGIEAYSDITAKLGLTGSVAAVSGIFAKKPGDGSAREQAASCQRVLGGGCNFAREYATKRYRSNLINWGMIPFESDFDYQIGDVVVVADVKRKLANGDTAFMAKVIRGDSITEITVAVASLTDAERAIIDKGCLINYYNSLRK